MAGETFPSDNNSLNTENNFENDVAFTPEEGVNDVDVDEVVAKAETSNEKGKVSRRAFLGTLAAAIAFANGCSKDEVPSSSPSETGDEGTKITDTAVNTTESSYDAETSTFTVEPSEILSSETEKKAGKPVVKKAVGEYDSYNDYFVYTPENTDIIPGDDYRNHTYDDLNEIQKHVDGDYPGGYLNIEEWLGGLGVDGSEITKDGDNVIIQNENSNVSIEFNSAFRMNYIADGKIICTFSGGKPTTKNERVFLFRNTADDEFSYVTTMTAEDVDVLEVFINAYTAGSTDNPLGANA